MPMRLCLSALIALTLLAACKEEEAPAATGAAGQGIALPSGGMVTLQEIITNAPGAEGATARFRFVLPGLTADQDRSDDMLALCEGQALPVIAGMVPAPQQIVISLADRETVFGAATPDAVQFFEAYRPDDGRCIWEMY